MQPLFTSSCQLKITSSAFARIANSNFMVSPVHVDVSFMASAIRFLGSLELNFISEAPLRLLELIAKQCVDLDISVKITRVFDAVSAFDVLR
jgi:hypothetical protein